MPAVLDITSIGEFEALRASDKVFFVDFYTDWCGPCKMISPVFESLANDAPEGTEFYKLNTDDVPDVAELLQISSIPVFYAYKGNQVLDRCRGANPTGLRTLVQRHQ